MAPKLSRTTNLSTQLCTCPVLFAIYLAATSADLVIPRLIWYLTYLPRSLFPFATPLFVRLIICTLHWILPLLLPRPTSPSNLPDKQSWSCGSPWATSSSLDAPSAAIPSFQFHISLYAGKNCLQTRHSCDSPRLVAHYPTVVPGLTPLKVRRRLANHYLGCNHGLD